MSSEPGPVDPPPQGDPVAALTPWTPLRPAGSSFGTHRLVEVGARLEMKKSLGYLLFGGAFFMLGLGVALVGLLRADWLLVLFGLPFTSIGGLVLRPTSIVFDGGARQFKTRKGAVPFSTIHAVQIIKEHVQGDDSDFWSYELNLVLEDGARINVVDHADLARIRSESLRISALVGCKVWDATNPAS